MQDEIFLNDLIEKTQQGHQFKYLYFWGHTSKQKIRSIKVVLVSGFYRHLSRMELNISRLNII